MWGLTRHAYAVENRVSLPTSPLGVNLHMVNGLLAIFGLATATGLNAYFPLLTVGLLARYTDLIKLNPPYDLLSNPAVLVLIAVLALLDFVGDKIPVVDHALHLVGLVVHPIAGAMVSLAAENSASGTHPVLAAVCGLILAGGTHAARAAARPVATVTTAGLGNPVVSLIEDIVSLILAVLAVLLPVLAFVLVVLIVGWTVRRILRFFRRRREPQPVPR